MNVFSFQFRELEQIYKNPKELTNELNVLKQRLAPWGIKESDGIVLDQATLRKIIAAENLTEEASAQLLVEWADKLGAIFKATKLSTSQLRDFFGAARTIQQQGFESPKSRRQFILLLPKLKYAAKRANAKGMDGLRDVLSAGIKFVGNDSSNFQRFMEFFEAILAYHKAYGGN